MTGAAEVDDDALMRAFCAGEVASLGALFDRHAARIKAFILRLTADEALAHDITQTTFLSVVKGRGRFGEGSRFVPWLYTIALNALRDHQRRGKREVLTADGVVPDGAVRDREPDPGLEHRVRAALQQLPEDQRQAVVLHQIEGFPFQEIALIAGVSESAVKVRAHRGYEKLRALLADAWWGDAR